MDRLPFVPQNEKDHEVLPVLTQEFQDVLRTPVYPDNISQNYKKYKVETEFDDLQTSALTTIKILEESQALKNDMTAVEKEIIAKHALAILQKENNLQILEELKLKRRSLFEKLSKHALETYNLIESGDLYPNAIEQYLDFTYNRHLHTCKPCKPDDINQQINRKESKKVPKTEGPPIVAPFRLEPPEINFHNYELGKIYREKVKLRNVTRKPQNFKCYDFPKESHFSLQILTNSSRLALGMCAEFLVTFEPTSFVDCTEFVQFKTSNGANLFLKVSNSRDQPMLVCYVLNLTRPWEFFNQARRENSNISEEKRKASNFTIDCGACLLGNFSLITVYMKNIGERGRFLIASESEWIFNELKPGATRNLELDQGSFTIFPYFFELEREEIGQIFILFIPEESGLSTEKIYIICDNNSYQEIEILGDCIIFTNSFLKVNLFLDDIFSYSRRKLSLRTIPHARNSFVLSICNNSPVTFSYYFALKTYIEETEEKKMEADWIKILYGTEMLPSYSVTDVVVQITPRTEDGGLYYIFLSLYLKDIPIKYANVVALVTQNESFIERKRHSEISAGPLHHEVSKNEAIISEFKLADMHIFELGIFCYVKVSEEVSQRIISYTGFSSPDSEKVLQFLKLSHSVLKFGVLPKNVKATKTFLVECLINHEVRWKIIEIFCKNSNYYMSEKSNLNVSEGILKKQDKVEVTYTLETKNKPKRWVSILILYSYFSCSCDDAIIEDICLVTYEVADPEISFHFDNNLGILTPKEFLYVAIPSYQTVYIHNSSTVIGCFYFLKPMGPNIDNLLINLCPQSGMVSPGATVEVKVKLIALTNGVFEDIQIPCFVGDCENLMFLPIMCAVADINVFFYLPHKNGGYMKWLWPPKTEMPSWIYDTPTTEGSFALQWGEGGIITPEVPTVESDILSGLIASDSPASAYPTVRMTEVIVKQPSKFSFFIENVTPMNGTFTATASNYGPSQSCVNHILVKAKTRTPEFFWNNECLEGYGIVVEPVYKSNTIVHYEVVKIDVWIYANTWGKYLEEMMVEISDLTPFCFNLLIEVTGLPIEFPFARNTTLPFPTLRFENIAYAAGQMTKNFTVTNISSVPVQLSWHVFSPVDYHQEFKAPFNFLLEFVDDLPTVHLAKKFYGCESCTKCVQIEPSFLVLEKQSTTTVAVTVFTDGFTPSQTKTHFKYSLIGFFELRNCDKFKESYFKRETGIDYAHAKLKLLVTLELPILQLDLTYDEAIIDIFVNDILLLTDYKFPEIYFTLRNVDKSFIEFYIEIEKPFSIVHARTVPTGIVNRLDMVLSRHEILQVMISCNFSHEDLLHYADSVYRLDEKEGIVITDSFVNCIRKPMKIHQKGIPCQMIPFEIRLHYPHIEVKPTVLKFDSCMLYRTKKTILSIYNMTGSLIKFEIYKTNPNEVFEVFPNHGEIARSTGMNKQFVDIAVYFTAKHCKMYLEKLRILTNIPQYYIDVPVSGQGSNDEKFYVD